MRVSLFAPIVVNVNAAKLVLETDGRGVLEFTLLEQPVRLYVDSTSYIYVTDIVIGDRVKLIENFASFSVNSNGIVKK